MYYINAKAVGFVVGGLAVYSTKLKLENTNLRRTNKSLKTTVLLQSQIMKITNEELLHQIKLRYEKPMTDAAFKNIVEHYED